MMALEGWREIAGKDEGRMKRKEAVAKVTLSLIDPSAINIFY